MPSVTYDKYDKGIDVSRGASVSDSNALLECLNCHIDEGKNVVMRGGARLIKNLQPGTKGLKAHDGKLATFSGSADVTHGDTPEADIIN